ncbi:hypothetical protein ACFYY8_31220 [Streptosporangium sp. NPDC001559]|uniref:hypothetical protein n=1 Tax=Streptosporangium sp. NPDC001559 TaxID=3366187 RepID=UPI0036E3BFE0
MKTARIIAALAFAALAVSGCTSDTTSDREKAQAVSGDQQRKYDKAVPFPSADLNYPLDRANLSEYLRRNNDRNRISYVYLLSMDAKVIAYYTIKGKVTSVSSQLLPQDDMQHPCSVSECWLTTDSAGDDGTYGGNEPGVFFFTTSGALVTWTGDYIQSDRPLDVKTPVSLVAKVGD